MKDFPARLFRHAQLTVASHAQRGVALLECLIALLIFSFGVLGIVGLEARAISFSVDSEDRNRAALFASEIASNMWLNGSVTVTAPALLALQASVSDPTKIGLPNGIVNIVPVAGATNSADITITWHPPSDLVGAALRVLTTRVILP